MVWQDDPDLRQRQLEHTDGLEDTRSLDAIALTVISACIGIQAADFPDTPQTAFRIFVLLILLMIFHRSLRAMYALVYFRQYKRAPIVFGLAIPAMAVVALYTGSIIGNFWLGIGLIGGWVGTFVYWISGNGLFKTAKQEDKK